jgi:hypothetical protein
MPRYALVTINSYHGKGDGVVWRDGELHVFLHGGEFESTPEQAKAVLDELSQNPKATIELVSDEIVDDEHGTRFLLVSSVFETLLNQALGRETDTCNPSAYVLASHAGSFTKGTLFSIGELSIAQVGVGGVLTEVFSASLKKHRSEERHAIEEMI